MGSAECSHCTRQDWQVLQPPIACSCMQASQSGTPAQVRGTCFNAFNLCKYCRCASEWWRGLQGMYMGPREDYVSCTGLSRCSSREPGWACHSTAGLHARWTQSLSASSLPCRLSLCAPVHAMKLPTAAIHAETSCIGKLGIVRAVLISGSHGSLKHTAQMLDDVHCDT